MQKIQFKANLGNEIKKVELSNPSGGGAGYHIYIDRFYHGTIVKVHQSWVGHLSPASDVTQTDIEVLGKLIELFESHDVVPDFVCLGATL